MISKFRLDYSLFLFFSKLSAPDARQLRVALNGFFDNIKLILQTMELTGSPFSESYSHYFG